MSELELDPALLEALRTLATHDVEFVVAGDVALAIHDDGGFVAGLTVVPASYGRNAARLCAALAAMDGELGIAGARTQTELDYRRIDLRQIAPCSFITRYVDVDVTFEPPGTAGFRDLLDDAERVQLAPGIRPLVAARDDLERIARNTTPVVGYAKPPKALPPEPGGPDIRAGRATRI
jgi:hypothetical protein